MYQSHGWAMEAHKNGGELDFQGSTLNPQTDV